MVPNFNGGATIGETLRSILDQNYPNLELIVVDGASTDNSVEVIRGYEDRLAYWRSEKDRGHYDAINHGFAQATGDVCAWLNSDDVYFPWTLQTVGRLFASVASVDWVIGQPSMMVEGAVVDVGSCRPIVQEFLQAGMYEGDRFPYLQQESSFWRRSLWEKAGGLDIRYTLAGDYELWTRFARYAPATASHFLLGGFSYHQCNRSVLNVGTYRQEVQQVIANLPPEYQELRTEMRAKIKLWTRWRSVSSLRNLVRWATKLREVRGPVLSWQSYTAEGEDLSRYQLETQKLF